MDRCGIVFCMARQNANLKEILNKNEYETLLAFHDIVEDILGSRFEKIIVFGRPQKKSRADSLDLLILVSETDHKDIEDIDLVAEDLSENIPAKIAPVLMDNATYQAYTGKKHPLIQDIESNGIEFIPESI